MRRTVVAFLALLAVLVTAGCGSDEVKASVVPEVTQTVEFVKSVIDTIREEERFEYPSQIATYLTSADGLIEFMPPNPDNDPEGAAAFEGLKPHKDVAIWPRPFEIGPFRYYLLVAGDDKRGEIVVSAFNSTEPEPFQIWRF